jgi:hypothetical protein
MGHWFLFTLFQGILVMTLLGKVFIGAMLILSVLFFGLAAAVNATHNNWRDAVTDPKTGFRVKLQETESVNQQLRAEVEAKQNELAKEQAARRAALSALQTQFSEARDELSKKDKQLSDLQAAHSELAATERSTQETLARLTKEAEQLRGLITTTRQDRDSQFTKVVQLTDSVASLQGELQALSERREQLLGQVTMMKSQLDILGVNPETPLDAAPEVKGEITVVGKSGLVEISLGADDGMRQGIELDVTRGSQYIGRIKVRTVGPDKAVCEIIESYRKGSIQPGDLVDSKLG